jgi:hypothetical protein
MSLCVALLAATFAALSSAHAAPQNAQCEPSSELRASRPGDGGAPTPVRLGLFLLDIVEVDDRRQSFLADFNLNLRWTDPRLARPDAPDSICVLPLDTVWNPRLRILNERDLQRKFEERVAVDAEGRVSYEQRFFGEVANRSDLTEFPFDRRSLALELTTVDYSENEVALSLNTERTGRVQALSVANWDVAEQRFELRAFPLLQNLTFAGAVVSYEATRRSAYYVWNAIVPLVLIVFMSWAVFWVNPAHLGAQLGLAATSMLSLIAYRFSLGSILPPVPYLTRMDAFLTSAFVLVFLALAEAVTTSAIADRGNASLAGRIDAAARWGFPALFGLASVWAFVL